MMQLGGSALVGHVLLLLAAAAPRGRVRARAEDRAVTGPAPGAKWPVPGWPPTWNMSMSTVWHLAGQRNISIDVSGVACIYLYTSIVD